VRTLYYFKLLRFCLSGGCLNLVESDVCQNCCKSDEYFACRLSFVRDDHTIVCAFLQLTQVYCAVANRSVLEHFTIPDREFDLWCMIYDKVSVPHRVFTHILLYTCFVLLAVAGYDTIRIHFAQYLYVSGKLGSKDC
jgi:hypothetical protein